MGGVPHGSVSESDPANDKKPDQEEDDDEEDVGEIGGDDWTHSEFDFEVLVQLEAGEVLGEAGFHADLCLGIVGVVGLVGLIRVLLLFLSKVNLSSWVWIIEITFSFYWTHFYLVGQIIQVD